MIYLLFSTVSIILKIDRFNFLLLFNIGQKILLINARNSSYGKVMFLLMFVCPQRVCVFQHAMEQVVGVYPIM